MRTWQGFSAPLPGRHNVLNAAAAFAIGLALGLPSKAFAGLLDGFAGLPHRLEFVREAGGVRYYNDSKATTPEASEKAFTSFNQPIVGIVGGYDKKIDLGGFGQLLADRTKAVVCIGQIKELLVREIQARVKAPGRPAIQTARGLPVRRPHGPRPGWSWRRGGPEPRLRQLRHVHQLRAARGDLPADRAGVLRALWQHARLAENILRIALPDHPREGRSHPASSRCR